MYAFTRRRSNNERHKSLQDADDGKLNLDRFVVVSQLVDLLMDHKAKDAHLGSTAVVELDSTLHKLDTIIKDVPAKVDESITEITRELGFASDYKRREKCKEQKSVAC